MRKVIPAAAIVALSFTASTAQVEDEFYGTYTLISSTRKILDTGQVETFTRERGFITYGKDGRMLVLIVRQKGFKVSRVGDDAAADAVSGGGRSRSPRI